MSNIITALSGVLPLPESLANRPPRALSANEAPDWDELWERHRFALMQPKSRHPGEREPADPMAEATAAALTMQEACGLDVLAEGGLGDDHAVLPLLRQLAGIDLEPSLVRAGAFLREIDPQRLTAPPTLRDRRYLRDRWRRAQRHSTRPVKLCLPGPLALAAAVEDRVFGGSLPVLANAFAQALNPTMRDLAEAGCPAVEIAEPALLAQSGLAMQGGLEALDRLWHRTDPAMQLWLRLVASDRAPPWADAEPLDGKAALAAFAGDLATIRLDVVAAEAGSAPPLEMLGQRDALRIALVETDRRGENADEAEDRLRAVVETAIGSLPPERLILAADGGRFERPGALQSRLARVAKASRLA